MLGGSGKHVLMDTSLGHVDPPDTTPSRDIRTLLQAAAGITRHDIDAVTLSHGHPDHVAGSVLRADDGELVPMFPNAVHYMQRAEYDYASDSMREAWKFDTYLGAVEEAGLLRVIDGEPQRFAVWAARSLKDSRDLSIRIVCFADRPDQRRPRPRPR